MSRRPSENERLLHGVKVVFFDAVGTLLYLPRGVGFHYAAVARRHGWSLDQGSLDAAFRECWQTMPPRAVAPSPRIDDDKGWWRQLVERVLTRCDAPGTSAEREAYFDELYAEFSRPGVWMLFPEVRQVIAELRPTYRLGLLSNFDGRLRLILSHLELGDVFDPIVLSSECGADKPAPEIFDLALNRAGVAPHETLHVGDDPEADWRGAEAAGVRVFRLKRPQNTLSDMLAATPER